MSTACFAFLTRQLRQLAGGNLVLALEGGYNLEVLKTASEQCLRALLNLSIEKISEEELARRPCPPAVETLQKTLAIQSAYWGETLKTANGQDNNVLSHMEAWQKDRETSAATTAAETLPAVAAAGSIGDLTALSGMASLSMKHHHRVGGRARPPNLNASTSGSEERESTASPDHNMATT